MKTLLVGAAGYVGSIIRPAIEREFDYRYFDRVPVAGRKGRTVIADVLDEGAVTRAIRGVDAIVYSALGMPAADRAKHIGCNDTESAFRVNVAGWHLFAFLGLQAGVRRFVYVSSLSVYNESQAGLGERVAPDAFYAYGFSKRAGEHVCDALAQACPGATVTSLRLMAPLSDERFARETSQNPNFRRSSHLHTGPDDLRGAVLASINLEKPGHHKVHVTSDARQEVFRWGHAMRVLGWRPRGA